MGGRFLAVNVDAGSTTDKKKDDSNKNNDEQPQQQGEKTANILTPVENSARQRRQLPHNARDSLTVALVQQACGSTRQQRVDYLSHSRLLHRAHLIDLEVVQHRLRHGVVGGWFG